jgi:hypothetical protein
MIENISVLTRYANELISEGIPAQVRTVTLPSDIDEEFKWTDQKWEDGVPVTKYFRRNEPEYLFLHGGYEISGVLSTIKKNIEDFVEEVDVFEFQYEHVWYRTENVLIANDEVLILGGKSRLHVL